MDVEDYLQDKLSKNLQYRLTALDRETIEKFGVVEYIFRKLMSKKFRKWSLDEDDSKKLREIIHQRVSSNLPLLFTFPFGGYKLWRLPTAPEVDWAEFFSISYYLSHIFPVAVAYRPGVEFYFSSDEVIIQRMDNISRKDTDAYTDSFRLLLGKFQKYFPKNIKMELRLVRNLYKPEEFEEELEQLVKKVSKKWRDEKDEKKRKRYLKMSELNIKMDGVEDWDSLSKADSQKRIAMGPIYHDAYISLSRRAQFVKGSDKIIIFPFPIRGIPCIPIGSTRASVNKFWMGVGVLESRKDSYIEHILSVSQLKSIEKTKQESVTVSVIPRLGNFKAISVFKSLPNFSRK